MEKKRELIRSRASNFLFPEEATFNGTKDFQACSLLPPASHTHPGTCKDGQFACDDDSVLCISREQMCDFEPDCHDGTEESQCGHYMVTDTSTGFLAAGQAVALSRSTAFRLQSVSNDIAYSVKLTPEEACGHKIY
ncbi:and LDL-receptor class A domain-containing 2-like [Podarcis lilfordi]|uniref:And LDL-receptor class A domain-containing 2-like n=1 Tax=Podarcis lilfordi TaxID=74358 RepID=A0AA35PDC2_9SAUR|nr:and LDL-receptor class A domain-containing 2-like [Podarcis lilfordi]